LHITFQYKLSHGKNNENSTPLITKKKKSFKMTEEHNQGQLPNLQPSVAISTVITGTNYCYIARLSLSKTSIVIG